MKPLVSILVTAYNKEGLIAYTLQSALSQTWPRKEIIVLDDGSTDGTAAVARRFASKELSVVSTENQGLSAAQNNALRLCQGDYIQYLDADDLLAPDKIAKQLGALQESDGSRKLLSCPWAYFRFRPGRARFVRNSLWEDLTPVEWLLKKMGENLHMGNMTWLVSRQLAEDAGPWDTRLHYDQDGEYFCRVLLASEGTRFVPDARAFYRISNSNRVSFIGKSDLKRSSLLRSLRLHIQYLHSLEDSERVRRASVKYLQNWYENFYADQKECVAELQGLARELDGSLEEPHLHWKYAWLKSLFGWNTARWAQTVLPEKKAALLKRWDKLMFDLER